MADNTVTPQRTKALLWNKEALDEFDTAERVARAAKDPKYTQVLADRDLPAGAAAALEALVTAARGFSAGAVKVSAEAEGSTRTESAERTALVAALRGVQAAARQKHAQSAPEKLKTFGIGTRLGTIGFARLTGIADAVLDTLTGDTLPGIKAAQQQELKDALAAYRSADANQGTAQSTATALRTQRDATLKEIKAARQTIQFAAEGAWPYSNSNNAAAREAFQLPLGKPFTGGR